ncbi:MarR family transcriptional regulator [Breoghania sp.]|uniref:MarR family winged helix-turn-helix transcriptional regulator n=1 Tax=Breoghania sp. TaxID=2065378 RepID=UPI002AA9639F|nr:MarR family transcriptional regulator [Breoghania sp.]
MVDANDMPGHLIRRLQQSAVAIFHHEVEGAGIDLTPVQFAALDQVARTPDIDQVTLAGLIAHDRTTITGVVDRLAAKGLITRTVSKNDRRARTLHVTEDGIALIARARPHVEAAQTAMLQGLEAREQEEFLRLMKKALKATNALSRAPLKQG